MEPPVKRVDSMTQGVAAERTHLEEGNPASPGLISMLYVF